MFDAFFTSSTMLDPSRPEIPHMNNLIIALS
jgi:hypothetical protein